MNTVTVPRRRFAVTLSLALAAATGLVVALGPGGRASAGDPAPVTGDGSDQISLDSIGDFDSPVYVAFAPGAPENVYVVEQGGTVRVVEAGVEATEPFLAITNLTDGGGEQGLLSIAFDPAYQSNGLFYAYYTDRSTGDIRIDEFHATADDDADESSRRAVLRIRHRFGSNHNGGQLQFGPDGFLYAGTGDGGAYGDPRENAQKTTSLLGKLLRINPHGDAPREYRSPAGNPFRGRKGRNEIYARGLRNPFRFSFDLQTGRIAIGDVGQNRFEEIDYEGARSLRGANFGWDRYEGFKRYNEPGDQEARTPSAKRHDRPIHAYNHSGRCSVIGGYVARDAATPTLYGRYVYADVCDGRLRSLVPKLKGATDVRPIGSETVARPTSFGQDPETGELYVASLDGPVYRIVPDPPCRPRARC